MPHSELTPPPASERLDQRAVAVGVVLCSRSAEKSAASHSDCVGQATPISAAWQLVCACAQPGEESGSAATVVQALGPPAGSVETSALPAASTATHRPADGQEMPRKSAGPAPSALGAIVLSSILATVHAAASAVGSVEVTASPAPSTATHRALDGQAIAVITALASIVAPCQPRAPAAGSVEV